MCNKIKVIVSDPTIENKLKFEIILDTRDLIGEDGVNEDLRKMKEAFEKRDHASLLRSLTSIVEKLESKTEGGLNGASQNT